MVSSAEAAGLPRMRNRVSTRNVKPGLFKMYFTSTTIYPTLLRTADSLPYGQQAFPFSTREAPKAKTASWPTHNATEATSKDIGYISIRRVASPMPTTERKRCSTTATTTRPGLQPQIRIKDGRMKSPVDTSRRFPYIASRPHMAIQGITFLTLASPRARHSKTPTTVLRTMFETSPLFNPRRLASTRQTQCHQAGTETTSRSPSAPD
jgi:hypothetical protein